MKYRKKPVVVNAVQWTGTNVLEMYSFINHHSILTPVVVDEPFDVGTLEGKHIASVGDYIIKGVAGEFYPCKPDIFELTYEKVEE